VIHDLSLSFLAARNKQTREYIALSNSEEYPRLKNCIFLCCNKEKIVQRIPYRQAFELNPKHPLTLNPTGMCLNETLKNIFLKDLFFFFFGL